MPEPIYSETNNSPSTKFAQHANITTTQISTHIPRLTNVYQKSNYESALINEPLKNVLCVIISDQY